MVPFDTLFLGFLIGLTHALEADHVAAVASLARKVTSFKESLKLGVTWGLGHTCTLFIFGFAVFIADKMNSQQLALTLEFFVGCMLFFMGGAVIKEIVKKRIHIHLHRHSDGITHLHFHSHVQDEADHKSNLHHHKHSQQFSYKALVVGMMHGMAGSAALILLTLNSVSSIEMGFVYMLLFGIGSILGMALLSTIILVPLKYSEYASSNTYQGLQFFIGLATLFLGMITMYQTSISRGLFT